MAWLYTQALRIGGDVTITLVNATDQEKEAYHILQHGGESDADFTARVQAQIAGKLRVLEGIRQQRADETNRFRPPPQSPEAGK
jgi:hypothetical protein